MSALNFVIKGEIALIAADTLALNSENRSPSHFQTKFYPVPHLKGIICGTGISQFIAQWAIKVHTSMLVKDIPHLDQHAPQSLRELWEEIDFPKVYSSKIFHIGYDENANKIRGFIYDSAKNFESNEWQDNIPYVQPMIDESKFQKGNNAIDELKEIVAIQRKDELMRPQASRSGIGGEVHIVVLEQNRTIILHEHRFEDFDELYRRMLENFSSNKSK